MTTLSEHDLPQVPEWIRIWMPRSEHHAAFAAWLHAPTGCRLLKLWYADPYGSSAWVYEVRHPDGRRRQAWATSLQDPVDEETVLQAASAAVGELVKVIDQAR